MKTNMNCVVLSIFITYALFLAMSCRDDDPQATETNLQRLAAHKWKLISVTVDGVDKTDLFTGLTLQWSQDKTFVATNGGEMWPSNGTWSVTDDSGKTLLVSLNDPDHVEVTIQTLDDSTLVISLHWNKTTLGSGRASSIAGDYVFEFKADN